MGQRPRYSALMLAARITLLHFSVTGHERHIAQPLVKTASGGNIAYLLAVLVPNVACATPQEITMDKHRVSGSANQAKGSIKETAGKMTGDSKTRAGGMADKAKGKIQNAVG